MLSLLFECEEDEQGGAEAVIDGIAGHRGEVGQEHGGDTYRHREQDAAGLESSRTPQGEAQREQDGHGTQAQRQETQIVDQAAVEQQRGYDRRSEDAHDRQARLCQLG